MKRRTFLQTTAGTVVAATLGTSPLFGQTANQRDITSEPNRPLESTGLQIRDVLKILKKGEKNNIPAVLREEILDNPNAVFIIYGGIETERDEKGSWKSCIGQMERFGHRVSNLVFRKGTDTKGRTFIKPNIVGLPKSITQSSGGNVHPYFIVGMVDGLRDIGNSNVAVGARGALRHPQVVSSGFQDLLDEHSLPLIEAHVQYFEHYKRSELVWHKNPEGLVARRFPTYKPVFDKKTTFVNIAHAHTHSVGHTTLSIKNLMGVMPRGYGHICDAWPTLDIWRRKYMKDFNREYRIAVEKEFIRHINMGFKHWDHGGYYKAYKSKGGYDAFLKAYKNYENSKGEKRKKAHNHIYDITDSWLFASEQWTQRMMDCVQVLPTPYVSMVEGTFARGARGTVHADFVTVGRSMVSVDTVTSWLMGHDPRELPYLRIANERGLGDNNIEHIPIYLLDEQGIKKADYRTLKRESLGIHIYRRRDLGPQFF
ncbi:DUF362 domain-containing protein [Candidatus Latescibacterota bacterium]